MMVNFFGLSIIIILIININGFASGVGEKNKFKKDAQEAYMKGNFDKAIKYYHYLLDTLGVNDDKAKLNLSHAYFQAEKPKEAASSYTALLNSQDMAIKSIAAQQIGVLSFQQQNYSKAIDFFKTSLKANPHNKEARYNYEIVKKMPTNNQQDQDQENQQDQDQQSQQDQDQQSQQDQDQQSQQDQDQQNQQDQDQQSQQDQDQQSQQQDQDQQSQQQDQESQASKQDKKDQEDQKALAEGEEEKDSDENAEKRQQAIEQRLMEMNISPEKARMILEAMRNNEMQYLQQKRKKGNTKNDGGPDW